MLKTIRLCAAAVLLAATLPTLPACAGSSRANPSANAAAQLAFGVNMARRGLWDEALFRFHEAEKLEPGNPRVLNNLGVAYEAVGEFDKALDHYQRALKAQPNSQEMKANYARFVEFYQSFKGNKEGGTTPQAQGIPSVRPGTGPLDPPAAPLPARPPSTPEDTPPPPADNRPPL